LRVKRRKTRRYNQHVGGRIVLDVCLPVETAEAIRVCAQVERYSISRVMSETLVAVFGGPKGVKS
jgi:hypothetical protein